MAKVPGAANIQRGPSLRDPGVNAPAAAFDLGGAGLVSLGEALKDRADTLKIAEDKLKEKRQAATDNEYITRYESEYAVRLAQRQQELEAAAAEGTLDDLPGALGEASREIDTAVRDELRNAGLAPSDTADQAATRYGTRTSTRAMVSGVTFEHNAKVSRAVSTIQGQLGTLAAKAVSDPDNYLRYQEEARVLIGRLSDLVPSADRDAAIAKAEGEIAMGAAQALALQDPGEMQRRLAEGEFDTYLDRAQKASVLGAARSEQDRRTREQEALRARALRTAEAKVDEYAALSTLGMRPEVPDLSAVHPEDRARLEARLETSNAVAQSSLALRGMTPAGRDTAVAAMRRQVEENPSARSLEIYEGLAKVAGRITAAEEEDAFSLDVRWGNVPPWQGEGEPTIRNEAYWSYVVSNTEGVVQRHPNGMPIPKAAMDEIESAFAGGDVQAQLVAVDRLSQLPGYARAQTSGKLNDEFGAEVSAAAMLSGVPGKAAIARDVLLGRQMTGPDTLKPSATVVRTAVTEAYGNAFSGTLIGTSEALVAAGISLYQKRSGVTREDSVDSDELARALRDVVPGSLIDRNGEKTYVVGQILESDDVDRALRAASVGVTKPGLPSVTTGPVVAFGHAFLGGETQPVNEVLHANGDPVEWADILEGALTPAGPGLFYVNTDFGLVKADVQVPGTERTVTVPYVLDLNAVMSFTPAPVPLGASQTGTPAADREGDIIKRGFALPPRMRSGG